jgi:hypothetical protein
MTNANDIPASTNMRLNPKVRYFADLASRLLGKPLTEITEDALLDRFKKVSIDPILELDSFVASDESRTIRYPLADKMELLWDERPIVRLEMLYCMFPHLMSDDDKTVWDYLFTRPDLYADNKFNYRVIVENWLTIKAEALSKVGR